MRMHALHGPYWEQFRCRGKVRWVGRPLERRPCHMCLTLAGASYSTVTVAVMNGWTVQKYGKTPGVSKVWVNASPGASSGECHTP